MSVRVHNILTGELESSYSTSVFLDHGITEGERGFQQKEAKETKRD